MKSTSFLFLIFFLATAASQLLHIEAAEPVVLLRDAPEIYFPGAPPAGQATHGETDCNSPLHWEGDTFYIFNSAGHPYRSSGRKLFEFESKYLKCEYNNKTNGGRWIEATWKLEHGPLYGWYHFEPTGVCSGTRLTAPKIGAVRSNDNGAHWHDLGVVLTAPADSLRCDTKNYYFAGGNGDFSVMLDDAGEFLYFFISTYTGGLSEQGVAVARMRWADRENPVGKVWKLRDGKWDETGLGGRVTSIFPAKTDWHMATADAFWGPSVHWNAHLKTYVMLLNRTMDSEWKQEGVYVSFNPDLSKPGGWSAPKKILGDLRKDQWYPQVVGLDAGGKESDKLAGEKARLFIRGESRWEILFQQ